MPAGTIEAPLSPSLPRDCGHECRVCKVKVVSLTDYAGHISSATHKQNVEAADKQRAGNDHDEEYFDQTLVDLIEKRKEQIRKEKEAAAARLAKEEERKRKEEFQQRVNQLKERYPLERMWQAPPQGFGGPGHHRSWHRSSYYDGSREEARHWHQNQQWRSATWHAQEPPRLQKWATVEFPNNRVNSNRTWGNGGQQNRLPWLSNGGSSNGLYGHNNIARYAPRAGPHSFMGCNPVCTNAPNFLGQTFTRFEGKGNVRNAQQDARFQNGEASLADSDYHSKNSKTLGSNPKLDKGCRWSPYPVASGSHVETHQSTSEKHQMASKPRKQPQCERAPVDPSLQNVEEDGRHSIKPTTQTHHVGDGSCSGTKANGSQRDGDQNGASGFSGEKANKPPLQVDQKSSSVSAQHSKTSSQSKPGGKQSGTKVPDGSLTSRQEKCLPESFRSVRQIGFERKGSLERTHNLGEQQNQGEPLKERSASESSGKATSQEKAPSASAEDGTFVQSLHVSTSTTEGVESASTAERDEENRNRVETQSPTAVQAEAMQVSEAGQSSESNAGRTGEAHAASGSDAAALCKLDLPPVLKRDLTKHMNSKSKAAGHEPNLNIARRVRNLSERSDTEKDSGLKPTVRQLINLASARRSVNWEQVYQEVRKKQDKGKGMPRFGIEMVPHEQESQSQEEDGLPLIEGFQWESLMEITSESKSRKRSLSESSLAPAAPHSSVFGSSKSEETVEKEESGSTLPSGSEKQERQPEEEVKSQKDDLHCTTAKVLQRFDLTLGDSSSGAEQYDGTGKRRRAAGDSKGTGLICLERDSKRRKVKSKRERLEIDQLLAVSLREEELSQSLQNVDGNLIQARAALEAAFMEVQRLMVVKQQITVEMSSLRNKRIDLLKGMQGTIEEAPGANPKEKHLDSFGAEPLESSSCVKCPPAPSTVVSSLTRAAECASHPSSSLPTNVVIKEEPRSPVCVSSELDADHSVTNCAHSTTPDNTNPLGAACSSGLSPDRNLDPPDGKGKSGKRVRKLKKRKVLNKAQGAEQLHSSDTEMDEEASRPRWLRQRRRPSGGSQVSTSSLPTDEGSRKTLGTPCLAVKTEKAEWNSPAENFEVAAAGQQPQKDAFVQAPPPPPVLPDQCKSEQRSLACNEVSSTSDMDLCKSSGRTSSDAFSDRAEDGVPTEGTFSGHKEAVNALQIHNGLLYTCSGDRTVQAFDLVSHKCVAVFEGHSSKVTCLLVSAAPSLHHRLYSGSSDQTIRCYRLKTRKFEQQFALSDRVLCLHSRWETLYAGLANGTVVTFNLKTNKQMDVFECHGPRAVSCLASSQEGARRILLVGSYDNTISVRAAHDGLLLRTLKGHTKSVLCMKVGSGLQRGETHHKRGKQKKITQVVNDLVISGSSDHSVYAHNIHGHSHAVTVVTVLGKVMVTACLDKVVRVYDLQDQLQVYGGYSDMVLCMAIHKNMIYTGCYDGSTKAVKLNLTQNHRCWWHGCPLVFGMMQHLQQHLINNHTSGNFQTFKCRWKNCEEFFSVRSSSKQMVTLHMQKHAEEEAAAKP
ncbi:hypothetical protein CCH79_00007850 [Gambusia affinis]|uniref:C2H2-type domain-containing protein n=1 Tax=Gambusia affinis TaxID=33528 RepID=A0A315WCZ2_GAMAF|nr:hypothetical protein CCH79_00007850 [Gambusia affinis]